MTPYGPIDLRPAWPALIVRSRGVNPRSLLNLGGPNSPPKPPIS
jgi:hypothetical protein